MTAILQTPFPKSISEIKIFEFGFNLQVCFWWSNDHAVSNRSGGALQWRHNEIDCVSNHQHLDCLLNRLLRCTSKKTSKLCFTRLLAFVKGIRRWPVRGFPSQRASNADNVSIWWCHHVAWPQTGDEPLHDPVLCRLFSAANLALAGFPLTNALGESMHSRH